MGLDVCDLSFSYKNKLVLNGVNLSVESGNVIAILGANGSGKTTLFKIIFDFLKPNRLYDDQTATDAMKALKGDIDRNTERLKGRRAL